MALELRLDDGGKPLLHFFLRRTKGRMKGWAVRSDPADAKGPMVPVWEIRLAVQPEEGAVKVALVCSALNHRGGLLFGCMRVDIVNTWLEIHRQLDLQAAIPEHQGRLHPGRRWMRSCAQREV